MERASLLFGVACVFLLTAADHLDAPAVIADPAADLTDVYAWMSEDASKLNLVLDVAAPRFSDAVQYVFHLSSMPAYGATGSALDVICSFDTEQRVTCWAGAEEAVSGDARTPLGIASESGRLRVFAGPRSDPFFFNGAGFSATIAAVKAAAGALQFDAAGCPDVDAATSAVLVQKLATDPAGKPAKNLFDGRVVSSLVVVIDKAIATAGGPIVSVWASTRR